MAKIIDITEKLEFEENPIIKVKDYELEINADAINLIKIMALISETPSANEISQACNIIFTKESVEKIKELHLKFKDFFELVMTAINIATGNYGDNNQGE